ncbi:hypothetical protein ACFYN0_26925 [Streptomyces sp. NPDC006704]|uniref:hypothetical protein n=1 Tax=Streptomyces sp. NPDC006704 TaxID=3364760 RepID=UPI003681B86E
MSSKLRARPGELFVRVVDDDEGNCTACAKPVVRAMFRWEDWKPRPDEEALGFGNDGRFVRSVHADGSPSHGELIEVFVKPRCLECRSEDLSYSDSGYGETARCGGCGWSKYTDRGD